MVLEAASAPDKDTMSSDDNGTVSTPSTIGGRGALYVGIASAFSAAVGYVVMLLATGLGSETSQFLAFWSFLFTCFGILSGISVETTRSVTNAVREGAAPGPRLVWLAAGSAGILGALMALTVPSGVTGPSRPTPRSWAGSCAPASWVRGPLGPRRLARRAGVVDDVQRHDRRRVGRPARPGRDGRRDRLDDGRPGSRVGTRRVHLDRGRPRLTEGARCPRVTR
ncbi:hypothetical protein NKG05_21050 [Oerskovia sp. M15]